MSFFGKKAGELKSVFFVLGAPNAAIKHQLDEFYKHNGENMKIVFCSDYYTMVDTERAKGQYPMGKEKRAQLPIAKDIHGIPTNCRAHAEPGENSLKTEIQLPKFLL